MFMYKVSYLEHNNVQHEKGLASADTYEMAASMVNEYYPDVISMTLEEWEDVITEEDLAEDFFPEKTDV